MENDLISRQKLIDDLEAWRKRLNRRVSLFDDMVIHALPAVFDLVNEQETVKAEPVRHGRWVWHEDWGHPSISEPHELLDAYWMCSTCGTDLLQYLKSHFPDIPSYTECSEEVPTLERCPNCGAKMDAKEDDHE